MPTSPALACCPTSTWSTPPMSAWTACWTPALTTAWNWSVRCHRTPAGRPATKLASTSPVSRSTGTTSRSPAPTARPPTTGARAPAATGHPSCRPPSAPPTAPPAPTAPAAPAPTNPRHLTFRPRPQYEAQRELRAEQATPAWQNRYAHRSGIEGTIAAVGQRGLVLGGPGVGQLGDELAQVLPGDAGEARMGQGRTDPCWSSHPGMIVRLSSCPHDPRDQPASRAPSRSMSRPPESRDDLKAQP